MNGRESLNPDGSKEMLRTISRVAGKKFESVIRLMQCNTYKRLIINSVGKITQHAWLTVHLKV